MGRVSPRRNGLTDLNHLEIFFPDAAFGAHKISRHVVPDRAGWYPVLFTTLRLIVDPATDNALPLAHAYVVRVE